METLRRSLRAYIDFGLEHPSHYVFVFCTPSSMFQSMTEESGRAIYGCGMASFYRLIDGLRACMEAGVIRKANVDLVAQSTWLMMHGLTSGLVCAADFPFVNKEMLIEHTLDRIIASLQ